MLALFLLILAACPVLIIAFFGIVSTVQAMPSIIACILFVILILLEVPRMITENTQTQSKDQGYLSGLLTIFAVFYLPALDAFIFRVVPIQEFILFLFFVGLSLVISGGAIRWLAAKQLGAEFSHEIRIKKDHQLMLTGLYSRVRHPAYLGTLLVIPGMSLMLGSYIGLFLLPLALFFVLQRIKTEEQVLTNAFPTAYLQYRKTTYKLLPWVI